MKMLNRWKIIVIINNWLEDKNLWADIGISLQWGQLFFY